MKAGSLIVALILLVKTQGIAAGIEPSGYLTLSAGETVRNVNNADSPLTGIYHLGLKGALTSKYWELGFLLESGVFNGYPAVGSVGEVKVHYPLFQENIRVGLGGGMDFQSYYRGNYRGQFNGPQRYTYRTAPMVIGQIQIFKKACVEYQSNFDTTIFWKFRLGYKLWG